MLFNQGFHFDTEAKAVMMDHIDKHRRRPHVAIARSIGNALDRARLRQANRLLEQSTGPVTVIELSTITDADIQASRVFSGGISPESKASS